MIKESEAKYLIGLLKSEGFPVSEIEEQLLRGSAGINIPNSTLDFGASLLFSKTLARALKEHAEALNKSAEASEKHAKGLKVATWALVIATIMLALITVFK